MQPPVSYPLYCHTFENKSSPPNPPAGLLVAVFDDVVGAALLQPPQSSSCATCGVAAAPQPGLLGAVCVVVGAGAAGWVAVFEEAHTSLLPQASMVEKPE